MLKRELRLGVLVLAASLITSAAGCNWSSNETQQQRDERTREEAAKETERLKPGIEQAGRELGKAAEQAAEDAHAAAQGVKEGWEQGAHAPLDLNSASEHQLAELPGITDREARKIIDNRPYREKRELLTRGVLPKSIYEKMEGQVTAK